MTMKTRTEMPSSGRIKLALVLATMSVFILWVIYGLVVWYRFDDVEQQGQWGSAFGAFGALMSAAALVAVVLTLWFQYRELSANEERLINAQLAMERSSRLEALHGLTQIFWEEAKDLPSTDTRAEAQTIRDRAATYRDRLSEELEVVLSQS